MIEPAHRLAEAIGYRFNDPELLQQALTHRSLGRLNNERLEFLGDSILGFVIADRLFDRFPDLDEGRLSRLRASLVKGDALAEMARELELGQYLRLGPGELRSGGHTRSSILSDALEALFAAVYLDGGYPAARDVILRLFATRLEHLNSRRHDKDPKTRLQEFLQSRHMELPQYRVLSIDGEAHNQTFTVLCQVAAYGKETQGSGSSRRKAEQSAAKKMLEQLNHE